MGLCLVHCFEVAFLHYVLHAGPHPAVQHKALVNLTLWMMLFLWINWCYLLTDPDFGALISAGSVTPVSWGLPSCWWLAGQNKDDRTLWSHYIARKMATINNSWQYFLWLCSFHSSQSTCCRVYCRKPAAVCCSIMLHQQLCHAGGMEVNDIIITIIITIKLMRSDLKVESSVPSLRSEQ